MKDLQKTLAEKTSTSEKEIAVLTQKLQTLEEDNAKLMKTYEQEVDALRRDKDELSKNHEESTLSGAASYEQIKRELEMSQSELQESKATLDKEQALWQGKFTFLEQQYKQKEKELEESQTSLQKTLQEQNQIFNDKSSNYEQNFNKTIAQMESKANQRLKE